MKYLFVFGFLLITVTSKAQDVLIGKSYNEINYEMTLLNHSLTKSGSTNIEGEWQATYLISEGFYYGFFFNKSDNICVGFKEILSKELLFAAIANLNKDYVKVDDANWISKDNNYRINLDVRDDIVVITHLKL